MFLESNDKFKTLIGFVLIIGLYIGARFYGLTDGCLWFDEIFSVHAAVHSWNDLFRFVALDLIHPPLFYVLLKIWILAGGESLLWLRLFPFFFSILAILPFLLLCRELKFSFAEKLIALAFLAVNGLLVKYTQEVRMYSVLFCLTVFALWLFVRFLNTSERRTLFWLFFVNLLLIYTHYFGWLVVVSQVLVVLLWRREFLKRFAFGLGFLAICFAPWAFAVINAAQENAGLKQNIGWAAKPNVKNVLPFVFSLHEPFYYQQSSVDAPNLLIVALPFAFICIAAMIAAVFLEKEKIVFGLLAVFVFAPVTIAFLASWLLPYSIWGIRHLIIIFAPYSLLVAFALNRLRPKALKIIALAVLGVLVLSGCAFHFARAKNVNIWCGWENLTKQVIEKDGTENLTIYAFEDLVAYHLWFAAKDSDRVRIVAIRDFPGIVEDKAYFLPRGFDEVKVGDKTALEADKFWVAYRDKAWNPTHPLMMDLSTRGYKFAARLEFKARGETAFLVKVER